MKARLDGKTYDVVIVGSPNVYPGYRLVDNTKYPGIARDFERTFRVLRSLPADIFLGAHGSYFDMEAKYDRWKHGGTLAFVDRDGYANFVNERERAFRNDLSKQQSTRP
jgi:metallo-beta-lactamase class B